ncbi:PfkB family carbohydrate kinase [Sphingomonas sp. CFBP 13706]|uniref:PfkB family carbohydrate kinase n=1 Tax=Sphingomonas sp. CFBP 13706 TaxID=2775314 RepID=UPI001FCFF572|nr:PfkB family carbohydrate kinase [Sphingomonas sp. CFBP 13706]
MRTKHGAPEVVGTGFTVLDRIYADGGFSAEALGGSCGNVLVSLAMLDRAVAPVLVLGCDDVGRKLVDEFQSAGADVSFISLHADLASPVLAQELDTTTGEHRFRFTCLDTDAEFPRYRSIGVDEAANADGAIGTCAVFYSDRVSVGIVTAMESARSSGAVVYFEPSDIDDEELFERALRAATILKYSSDRLGGDLDARTAASGAISIVTHGEAGLEMRQGTDVRWCDAIATDRVMDTCGSGDMVSVGLIDWLLSSRGTPGPEMTLGGLVRGVVAGQRLAAENCGYAGARGLFQEKGAMHARRILSLP